MSQSTRQDAKVHRRSGGVFTLAELLVGFTACCAILGIGSQIRPQGSAMPSSIAAVLVAAATGAMVGCTIAAAHRWTAGGIALADIVSFIGGTMGGLAVMVELRLPIVVAAGLILCVLALLFRRLRLRANNTSSAESTGQTRG